MPNHGGNLQHNHNEQSVKHPQYKPIQISNKKIAEMLIVCLPCHFDYGIAPVSCARGTPLSVLYDTHVFTMTRTYMQLNLSSIRSGPRTQGTWDFQFMVCQAYNS